MRVKAIQRGYYGSLREPDEIFSIDDKADFSAVWMEEVESESKAKKKPKDDDNAGNDSASA